MSRFSRVATAFTLLATTACTQPAAQIDLKGQNTYGRNGNNNSSNYASSAPTSYHTPSAYVTSSNSAPSYSAPVSTTTEQTASVQSIGVSDLAPPSQTAAAAPAPAAPAPVASNSSSHVPSVNRWTGKAHFSDAQSSDESTSKNEKPVAQLDSVISKTSAKPAHKDFGKPVNLTSSRDQASRDSGFLWPVTGKKIISGFGPKGSGKVNDGINIASADGEPVWAAADGEVVYVGNELQGYGNMVLIKHAGNKTTTYAHLSRYTVDKYDRIKQGDIIGYVGTSGNVKEPQLHFAVRNGKEAVDPTKYISRNVAGL